MRTEELKKILVIQLTMTSMNNFFGVPLVHCEDLDDSDTLGDGSILGGIYGGKGVPVGVHFKRR